MKPKRPSNPTNHANVLGSSKVQDDTGSRLRTDTKPLRVLVLTLKPRGYSPGQRFRLEQWGSYMRSEHNVVMDFAPFESPTLTALLYEPKKRLLKALWIMRDYIRRAGTIFKCRKYDAVVVYREAALIGPAVYERLITWLKIPLLFDFDDAIWESPISPVNGNFSRLHFWGKTATTCKIASAVIVGNEYLATYARRYNPCVWVIPTTIDLETYNLSPETESDQPFTVCWTGSITTLRLFELARPALERVAEHRPLRVKVICNRPPSKPIRGADNVFVEWKEEGEAADIANCHVGIMPLPDEQYFTGKCALKALQFMATGRPVVISPVGVNAELIKDGENGYLATTDDDWVNRLNKLADSRELRAKLGLAGRKTVEQDYSAKAAAAQFNRALRNSVERMETSREISCSNGEEIFGNALP